MSLKKGSLGIHLGFLPVLSWANSLVRIAITRYVTPGGRFIKYKTLPLSARSVMVADHSLAVSNGCAGGCRRRLVLMRMTWLVFQLLRRRGRQRWVFGTLKLS